MGSWSLRSFRCFAGQKFLILDDAGDVFACEILEDKKLGNLRDFNYRLEDLLNSEDARRTIQYIKDEKCNCTWECAINMSWIYSPVNAFTTAVQSLKYF